MIKKKNQFVLVSVGFPEEIEDANNKGIYTNFMLENKESYVSCELQAG